MAGQRGVDNMYSNNKLRRRLRKARTMLAWTVLAGLATAAWAFDETQPPTSPGLTGILPKEVPEALEADAFSNLGKNWEAWGNEASQSIAKLYEALPEEIGKQRELLAEAKTRLQVMEKAMGDRKYYMIAGPLTRLSSSLSRRLDLSEAILDTLEMDLQAEHSKRLKARSDAVLSAIQALKSSLQKIPGGNAWVGYVKAEELASALKYDVAGDATIAAANTTKAKLASRESVTDEAQKTFLSRAMFLNLESAVNHYLSVVENAPTDATIPKLREAFTALVQNLDAHDETASSVNAAQAREAFSTIRKLAADEGDRVTHVLQKHYFNYNIRVVTTESFLSQLMSDSHTEQGQVTDYVLGANVSGYQTTTTNVSVDLKPSASEARWLIKLSGNINSNTQGVTSQATVYTQGNHSFSASKEVRFNGTNFTTGPGDINVNPHNTTTGVATAFTGRLFGRIADNIAMQETEARRGQAEAIAASRVRERVLPRFNEEVDAAFVKAQGQLKTDLYDHLRETNLYPDAMLFQTTENQFRANTRLMSTTELAANSPPVGFTYPQGATLFIHESEMNNGADRIGLAGKTMDDEQLRAHLEEFFSKALNRKFTIDKPANTEESSDDDDSSKPPSTFVFAENDPIRIRLLDGEFSLIFRAGFQREGGDPIPQQVITVPLSFEVDGSQIHIKRGTVKVSAVEGGGAGQIATAGVIRRKIQSTLPERDVSSQFTLRGTRHDLKASIRSIRIVDGWAIVNVQ